MSEEVAIDPRLNHTVRFHGIQLNVVVKDEVSGVETEGVIHLQRTGKVAMSKPYWSHSQDIAAKCIPILTAAASAITQVALDPSKWPTFEQEQAGEGQEPLPEPQEE